jgi:hypothetical protein
MTTLTTYSVELTEAQVDEFIEALAVLQSLRLLPMTVTDTDVIEGEFSEEEAATALEGLAQEMQSHLTVVPDIESVPELKVGDRVRLLSEDVVDGYGSAFRGHSVGDVFTLTVEFPENGSKALDYYGENPGVGSIYVIPSLLERVEFVEGDRVQVSADPHFTSGSFTDYVSKDWHGIEGVVLEAPTVHGERIAKVGRESGAGYQFIDFDSLELLA